MTLTRTQFFVLIFLLFIAPFYFYKCFWLARSSKAVGQLKFIGHTLELQGISSHPVILFKAGNDSIFFNGNVKLEQKPGDYIPIRYQTHNPTDARINTFLSIWGDSIMYSLWPLLVFLVLALTPERMGPIIPRHSKIILGKKSLIHIIPPDHLAQ
jgi:hypothetical protein